MHRLTILLVAASVHAACGRTPPAETKAEAPAPVAPAAPAPVSQVGQTGESPIVNTRGDPIGTAHLTEGPRGLLIRLEFQPRALSPGWHGLHFHERGQGCDDGPAGFQAAGGHVGHAAGKHGLLNPNGPEPGDLPSIYVPASGAFEVEVYSPFLTLGQGPGRTAIWDADGASLIIHANRDDQQSQPIGGAGDRVACAVFTAG
jgi:Cu-Zn family superoxide dismutase